MSYILKIRSVFCMYINTLNGCLLSTKVAKGFSFSFVRSKSLIVPSFIKRPLKFESSQSSLEDTVDRHV